MTAIEQISVTTKDLATLYGVTEKYISELVNEHGHPKTAWNEYNLFESLKWWLNYKDEIHRREIAKIKEEDPQKALTRTNDKLKQLQYEERIHSLLPVELVRHAWTTEIKKISKALDVLPITVSPLLRDVTDQDEIVRIIADKIDEVRYRISDLPIFQDDPNNEMENEYDNYDLD